MSDPVGPIVDRAFDAGLLILQAGPSVLRFLPPLVISLHDIHRGVAILEEVL